MAWVIQHEFVDPAGRLRWHMGRAGTFMTSGNDSGSGGKTHDGPVFVSVVVADMRLLKRTPEHKAFWQGPDPLAEWLCYSKNPSAMVRTLLPCARWL